MPSPLPRPIRRRNSRIEFRAHGAQLRVHKRYEATFSAAQEYAAYEGLDRLLENLPGVRTPQRYPAMPGVEEIVLEYVDGRPLTELLMGGEWALLDMLRPRLLGLLQRLGGSPSAVDADPGNLIWDGRHLVVLDPLLQSPPSPHLAAAVYLHGIGKCALRRFWRPLLATRLVAEARSLRRQYCQAQACAPAALDRDYRGYLEVVARWNREASRAEFWLLGWLRQWLLAPAYRGYARLLGAPPD